MTTFQGSKPEKMAFLHKEFKIINSKLPAAIYIPFFKSKIL